MSDHPSSDEATRYLSWLNDAFALWAQGVDAVHHGRDWSDVIQKLRNTVASYPVLPFYAAYHHTWVRLMDDTVLWAQSPSDATWRDVNEAYTILHTEFNRLRDRR